MFHRHTRAALPAILLLLSLLLSLSACGGNPSGGTGGEAGNAGGTASNLPVTETGTVFFPDDYLPLPEMEGSLSSACLSGDSLYLLTRENVPARVTVSGVSFLDSTVSFRLYRAPAAGGEAELLPDFTVPALPEDTGGTVSLLIEGPGGDGTFWLSCRLTYYSYDFPEGFDPDRDKRSDYITEIVDQVFYLLLDGTGRELRRVEGSALAAAAEEDLDACRVVFDLSGNCYVLSDAAVHILDPELQPVATLSAAEDEFLNTGDTVLLPNGLPAVQTLLINNLTGESATRMRELDPAAGDWGRSWPVPSNADSFYSGGGDFLFFYTSGDSVYGVTGEGTGVRRLFSWLDVHLNDYPTLFTPLSDGRLAVISTRWDGDQNPRVLALLRDIPESEAVVPEKTVLTYATTMQVDSTAERFIKSFNTTHDDCVIQIRDYLEEAGGDYEAAQLLFRTELLAGRVPDILDLNGIDVAALEDQGYLEDLWPWIDGDGELSREDLMIKPLEAVQRRGELHYISDSFAISSLAVNPSRVSAAAGWTLADLRAAWEAQPENTLFFYPEDTRDAVFGDFFSSYCRGMVDWDTGVCSFDSPEFRDLLTFCATLPAEPMTKADLAERGISDDVVERLYTGQQMLDMVYISSPYGLQQDIAILGGEVNYIGYPTPDGRCGSSFGLSRAVAMSSAGEHKEEAWEFLRLYLLPRLSSAVIYGGVTSLPINKQDFDLMVERDMTMNPGMSSTYSFMTVETHTMTQEELDILMNLYDSIDVADGSRNLGNLYDTISVHAGAYFSGDKSLEETVELIQNAATLYVNERR